MQKSKPTKVSYLVAYEDQDSSTNRLTPETIGTLLSKCNGEQLTRAIAEMISNVDLYGKSDQQQEINQIFSAVSIFWCSSENKRPTPQLLDALGLNQSPKQVMSEALDEQRDSRLAKLYEDKTVDEPVIYDINTLDKPYP